MATPPLPAARTLPIRRLEKPEEFRQVDELFQAVWRSDPPSGLSPPLQRAVQDNGGLILGAFADIHLVGFTFGFLGWDGERLFHYSHLTGVRAEYQNHGLGQRLKERQRAEVLSLGLREIRWTFDPLQSRNAFLNLRRLGARADRYHIHYYGQMPDRLNLGQETDRLRVRWVLDDPGVEERLGGRLPTTEEDRARVAAAVPLVETELGDVGLRVPASVQEPSGVAASVEVPYDLEAIREHAPETLRAWRHATRDAFRAALDADWWIDDFAVVSIAHERRAFYLLRPPPAPAFPPPLSSA